MRRPFREYHLLQILSFFEEQSLPLDVFLRNYFRTNRSVGSKDRKEICETLYGMIRWRGLLDHMAEIPLSWENPIARSYTKFSQNACGRSSSSQHTFGSVFQNRFTNCSSAALERRKLFNFVFPVMNQLQRQSASIS